MARVRVHPCGVAFDVEQGESMMTGATRAGIRWPSVCGGQAQCGVCYVEITANDAPLPAPSSEEAALLRRVAARPGRGGIIRLACQLAIAADVQVYRVGIRPPVGTS